MTTSTSRAAILFAAAAIFPAGLASAGNLYDFKPLDTTSLGVNYLAEFLGSDQAGEAVFASSVVGLPNTNAVIVNVLNGTAEPLPESFFPTAISLNGQYVPGFVRGSADVQRVYDRHTGALLEVPSLGTPTGPLFALANGLFASNFDAGGSLRGQVIDLQTGAVTAIPSSVPFRITGVSQDQTTLLGHSEGRPAVVPIATLIPEVLTIPPGTSFVTLADFRDGEGFGTASIAGTLFPALLNVTGDSTVLAAINGSGGTGGFFGSNGALFGGAVGALNLTWPVTFDATGGPASELRFSNVDLWIPYAKPAAEVAPGVLLQQGKFGESGPVRWGLASRNVPEPSSLVLLALGALSFVLIAKPGPR